MKEKKNLLPLRLQFFASESESDNSESNKAENLEQNESENEENKDGDVKTFTQEQVNAMMSKEKRQGKNSVLKALGFKSEEEAKKAIELLNTLQNSQKTAEEKLEDEKKLNGEKIAEITKRAEIAERKLACLEIGVKSDMIDDVLAIAAIKVDEDNDLKSVLASMKKDEKYDTFFKNKQINKGTGNNPNHTSNKDTKPLGLGARLGEREKNKEVKKSSFFDN